jgi:hypothetical protein
LLPEPNGNEPNQSQFLFATHVAFREENGMRSRYNLELLLRTVRAEDGSIETIPNLKDFRDPQFDSLRQNIFRQDSEPGSNTKKFVIHPLLTLCKKRDPSGRVVQFERFLSAIVRLNLMEDDFVHKDEAE